MVKISSIFVSFLENLNVIKAHGSHKFGTKIFMMVNRVFNSEFLCYNCNGKKKPENRVNKNNKLKSPIHCA